MNTTFKKNSLSLAVSSLLFISLANSYAASNSPGSSEPRENSASSTNLISGNSAGTASGNNSSFIVPIANAISANGRFLAFLSDASNLVVNDTNRERDVFVRDLKTGTTTLASVNFLGTASANSVSDSVALSKNGRFVAFVSDANNLVPNDTNGTYDVFVRDLTTGVTTMASVNSSGTSGGNNMSSYPYLSANGRFVGFVSYASDLVPNDTNGGLSDIFVRDLKLGKTTLVSVNSAGTASGNSLSNTLALSDNGRYVAFVSYASDLVSNDTNGEIGIGSDIFVRDLKAGTTTLVRGGGDTIFPVISANGRYVLFSSYDTDLVANDTNNSSDVFIHDLKTGVTSLVSVNSAGTASGNSTSDAPVISANGRMVVFGSYASDMVENDTNGAGDLFVRDLKTGKTSLVSINSAGAASGNDSSGFPSLNANVISADGRFITFASSASDLVPNDTNGTADVFVRDLKTGVTRLVSVNSSGVDSGNNYSNYSVISANGKVIGFSSEASDLVPNDRNRSTDMFVSPNP
ncbi:MAG: TolB family protein [Methylobacter sp.]